MANAAIQKNSALLPAVLDALATPFRAIASMMVAIAEANERHQKVEQLQALSDEQLEKLGIQRQDIVRYVFRDRLGF